MLPEDYIWINATVPVQSSPAGGMQRYLCRHGLSIMEMLGKYLEQRMHAQEYMEAAGTQGVLLVSMGTVVELGAICPASMTCKWKASFVPVPYTSVKFQGGCLSDTRPSHTQTTSAFL